MWFCSPLPAWHKKRASPGTLDPDTCASAASSEAYSKCGNSALNAASPAGEFSSSFFHLGTRVVLALRVVHRGHRLLRLYPFCWRDGIWPESAALVCDLVHARDSRLWLLACPGVPDSAGQSSRGKQKCRVCWLQGNTITTCPLYLNATQACGSGRATRTVCQVARKMCNVPVHSEDTQVAKIPKWSRQRTSLAVSTAWMTCTPALRRSCGSAPWRRVNRNEIARTGRRP